MNLKVGDSVWLQPRNSEPRKMKIESETKLSWVVGTAPWDYKLSKKEARAGKVAFEFKSTYGTNYIYTDCEQFEKEQWVRNVQFDLSEVVRKSYDYEKLKQVAALFDYKERT